MRRTVETLVYKLRPGSGPEFDRIMHEISVPLHERIGMDVVAYGSSLDDPDAYFLIRAYDSLVHLRASQEAFYASEAWRKGAREDIVSRIETAQRFVVELAPEAVTALRQMRSDGEGG